jgi:hypothetical protein
MTGGRGTRRKQLLYDLEEKKGYWKLKEEPIYHTVENWLWKRLLMMMVVMIMMMMTLRP